MKSLKDARLQAGYTSRGDAAKAAGIDRDQLGRWERGVHRPSVDALLVLADLYGTTVDALLGRIPGPTPAA